MRGTKPSLMIATAIVVGFAAWSGAFYDASGGQMATAGIRLLAGLDKGQIAKATFEFDSPERLDWHFIPRPRKGLPIKEMNGAQRALAFGLLQSGLGASGFLKATTVMSLEQILRDVEQGRGPVRDPELYFFSVFGKPSNRGKWGWRVEGHHLSLNFTIEDGKIISATPTFFGANPAEVRQGTREGLRALGDVEDRALRLVQSLDDAQAKTAVVDAAAPKDIRAANTPQPPTEDAVGLSFAEMNEEQKGMLKALVESYTSDVPTEVGQAWMSEIREAGPENVKFAWFGDRDRSKPHAYRVQGPTFLIEFNNTQNEGNHIHSVWRSMLGDFGVPVAAK